MKFKHHFLSTFQLSIGTAFISFLITAQAQGQSRQLHYTPTSTTSASSANGTQASRTVAPVSAISSFNDACVKRMKEESTMYSNSVGWTAACAQEYNKRKLAYDQLVKKCEQDAANDRVKSITCINKNKWVVSSWNRAQTVRANTHTILGETAGPGLSGQLEAKLKEQSRAQEIATLEEKKKQQKSDEADLSKKKKDAPEKLLTTAERMRILEKEANEKKLALESVQEIQKRNKEIFKEKNEALAQKFKQGELAQDDYERQLSANRSAYRSGTGDYTGASNQEGNAYEGNTSKKGLRQAERTARRELRAKSKEINETFEQGEIKEENQARQYGGRYGGLDKGKTEMINMGLEVARSNFQSIQEQTLAMKNDGERAKLQEKGMNASQSDAIKTQAAQLNNAAKTVGRQALITTAMGGYQMYRGMQHLKSRNNVETAHKNVERDITVTREEAEKAYAMADQMKKAADDKRKKANLSTTTKEEAMTLMADASDLEREANTKIAEGNSYKQRAENYDRNRDLNKQLEVEAQVELASKQGVVAAQTMLKAAQLNKERVQAKEMAAQYNKFAGQVSGGGFVFNPNPMNPNQPGNDPNQNPNQDPNVVTPIADNEQGIDAGQDAFDPNLGLDDVQGPAAGDFQAGKTATDGGGGGGGIGGAAGTTAAQDDSKGGDGGPAGKNQVGGSYAGNENGGPGSRFSRPGASGTADNSWLEMMKKFLPGEDGAGDVAKKEMEYDRSPASDQPSVLGKNKNIFEEISKKYQKKTAEGAIVFSGGQS